jgi:integrase
MTHPPRYRLPKYIQAFVDRETGLAYYYFRRRGAPRVRLPGLPYSAEFMAAYQRALEQHRPTAKTGVPARGSIADVVARYIPPPLLDAHTAPDLRLHLHRWTDSTLKDRRGILRKYAREHGHKPIASVTQDELTRLLESMPPGAAENLLKAIRGMMKWGVEKGELKTDPSAGVKLKRRKSDGFHSWSEEEITRFEFHHPVGSKARLAFALALYTGQRRGDVIRMGRQHLRVCEDKDLRALGVLNILPLRQQKTGTPVKVPIHPELQMILDATPSEHLTFIVNAWGKPFTPGTFSNWFRAQCDAAKLPKVCSVHGLRKAAGRRLADVGCSTHDIMAVLGHKTLAEAERYTREADRARGASRAIATVIKARPKVSRKRTRFDTSSV